jgi:hypothetical protein
MLLDRVVALARERASRTLSILPEQGPYAITESVDFRGRATEGIASVLEVRIVGLGLIGLQASEPAVSCFLGIRIRLVRTSDGKSLYESTVGYVGVAQPLDEWVAHDAARFSEEVQAAVGWAAERIVDQVFLRQSQPEDTLRVRVRPTTLRDLEGRLFGEGGFLLGSRRFDAEFEEVTLRAEEGRRLRALLPQIARAPRDSRFTLEGTIDGVPFTIEMEKDEKTRISADFEGLEFVHPDEARGFVESFGPARPGVEVTLDGYAGGRRIHVTLRRGGVTLADRGAGLPGRRIERIEPDEALKVRILPATLEDIREKLLGERGLVTRGQRFEAEFEDVAVTVEDIKLFGELFRGALRARPRSELKLEGALEGVPFKAELLVDREGHSRLGFEGFVFASEHDVDEFLDRFDGVDGLRELTVTGSVAGRGIRRSQVWR